MRNFIENNVSIAGISGYLLGVGAAALIPGTISATGAILCLCWGVMIPIAWEMWGRRVDKDLRNAAYTAGLNTKMEK